MRIVFKEKKSTVWESTSTHKQQKMVIGAINRTLQSCAK